ncbi:MAG TPA: alanyl-tRNA synthetase [Chitinophagales bacterium]|nr:alanyl-tRNA synthetase [Chitinophagales bacterium]
MSFRIPDKTKIYLKRIGWAGFFFFLIKGILWLVAGAAIIDWFKRTF